MYWLAMQGLKKQLKDAAYITVRLKPPCDASQDTDVESFVPRTCCRRFRIYRKVKLRYLPRLLMTKYIATLTPPS